MRTTLKRGIGQAAGLNGNGHSAAPPLFGPIARYRRPEPPRRSMIGLILRGFGWLVLALAVVGAGVAGGVYLYAARDARRRSRRTRRKLKIADTELAAIPLAVLAGDRARRGLRRPRQDVGREPVRGLQLRHADAAPCRPDDPHAVAALVPARPLREHLLPRRHGLHAGPHQRGLGDLRPTVRPERSTRSST